ncbi:MAG: DNA polymerase III subunit beta [Victivallaceae bacterium]|nr:DNA polymerase III subunit beta [Victivallaceae bacterium]
MKISLNRQEFLNSLQKIINIVGNKSTLPVLANILFEAQNGKLTLTTTDLEIRVSAVLSADIEIEGKTTLPAKKLFSMVGKFMADTILIETNEKHHSQIICGSSKFMLLGLVADDFPLAKDFSVLKGFKMKEGDLSKMIDQISYAVSVDDSRKALHGILCSIKENTVVMAATDGKRLAVTERVADEVNGEDMDVIIPLKAANEVKRIMDGSGLVSIEIGEKQVFFTTDSVKIETKLIEGNYPNYRQVIPTEFSKVIEVDKNVLGSKLELVSLALADSASYVIVTFENNQIVLNASSSSVGEGRDSIDIEYAHEKIEVSFNAAFLAAPLRHCDADKVKIKFNDNITPVAIEGGDGFLYVIMPLRNK